MGNRYSFNSKGVFMMDKVGIDLGGTNIRVALVDENWRVIDQVETRTEAEKGPDYTIQKMIHLTKEITLGKNISGIGIGSPGPLDPVQGIILSPPNLPGWDGIELVKMFKEHFQLQVSLNNDANTAALAEAVAGSGKGYKSVYYITVSTGVGGGLVINGKIFNGAIGYAGEIGNMIVQPNGYKHANLNPGSLEAYASGTAIGRRAKEMGIGQSAGEVFHLASQDDAKAKLIIEEAADYLAIGIANIAHTVNPEIFILGGGVMKSAGLLLPILEKKVRAYVYPGLSKTVKIVPAQLGGSTGVIGAAMLLK